MIFFWIVINTTPVYVSIVSHNEEPKNSAYEDYTKNRDYYLLHRENLRKFALMLSQHNVKYNFQSDWTFLVACLMFDTDSVIKNTNNKNIVRWLKEDIKAEVDPHAHETEYNYADVAKLIDSLGVQPSNVVGGFIQYPVDSSVFDHFLSPIKGWRYDYTWKPKILWGAASFLHQGKESYESGIWKPKDKYHFTQHDDAQHLVYIGKGYNKNPFEGIYKLVEEIENGTAPPNKIYTYTIFVAQNMINDQYIADFEKELIKLNPLVSQGKVIFTGLTELVEIWKTQYDSVPNIYLSPEGIKEKETKNIFWDFKHGSLYITLFSKSNVKIEIFDISGRKKYSFLLRLSKGEHKIELKPSSLSKGVYFLKLSLDRKKVLNEKIINF